MADRCPGCNANLRAAVERREARGVKLAPIGSSEPADGYYELPDSCSAPGCARFVALAKAARVVVSTRRELPRLESGAVPVDLDVAISSLAAELEKQR